tara:strand:- start:42 stop:1220 length:1179 start_codon:yes stop_codon:yes gene_type:complete
VAGLLDPYDDINPSLDDAVDNIWETRRKKRGGRSEYLLESRLNPYSKYGPSKTSLPKGSYYENLPGYRIPTSFDAIAQSTPIWNTLELLPGTGIGTKMVGMAGSVATLPLKSETMKKLLVEAKELGIKKAIPIKEFMSQRLKGMGYKSGVQVNSVRQMEDPNKYGKYDWNQSDATELGYDPIRRKEKEEALDALGIKFPDKSNPNYKDNLRYKYKYWTDDEWRLMVLTRNATRKSTEASARREMIEKSGTENLPEKVQRTMARDRVRSVIENMSREDAKRGGGFHITKEEIEKIKKQLFPVKLKEIQEGTPLIYRMTIDHYYPRHGAVVRGGQEIGSGLTTLKNITDSKGKLRLVTLLENIQKSNIIPGRLLHQEQKSWRKLPSKTSVVDLL